MKKVLLSLVLVGVLALMGCGPAKPEVPAGPTLLERVVALEAKVVRLDAAVAGIPTADIRAFRGELNRVSADVSKIRTDLDAARSKLGGLDVVEVKTELSKRLDALDTKLSVFETKLSALDTRVGALEGGGSSPSGLFTASIVAWYSTTHTFRVQVVNNLGVASWVAIRITPTPGAIPQGLFPVPGAAGCYQPSGGFPTGTTNWDFVAGSAGETTVEVVYIFTW